MRKAEADRAAGDGRWTRFWRGALAGAWPRILLAAAVVGGVLAASGGFGTGALRIVPRLAYWLALFLVGAGVGRLAARRLVPRSWLDGRPLAAVALLTVAITLAMTPVVAVSSAWASHRAFQVVRLWEVFPSTLATTLGMTVLAFMMIRAPHAPRTPVENDGPTPEGGGPRTLAPELVVQEPVAPAPTARLLARLPARLAGASLLAVEAEDHYLRLHTSRGDDLILLRLADALGELEGIDGARVHRSWWVARDAVRSVERADGRATLTLSSGLQAPVSRAYAKALREAGWF